MKTISASRRWAVEEFGGVELGDRRRGARTVSLASAVAETPAGRVTQVFETDAEREAAFRWLRNDGVDANALSAASATATVVRCADRPFVFVAVDQSSIRVVDHTGEKGFGHVGPGSRKRAWGLQVMTALAVTDAGSTVGLAGQQWWRRKDERSPIYSKDRRPLEERESGLWATVMGQCLDAFEQGRSRCQPWFQLDRGADACHVLMLAQRREALVTVRSAYNRRLVGHGERRHLWDVVKSGPVRGGMRLELSRGQARRRGRSHRTPVSLSVRYQPVKLHLRDIITRKPHEMDLVAVHVREKRPPRGCDRIEWVLLTTASVTSLEDALLVISGYTQRWRVEDFHRTWKSGACDIESSQIRSPAAFQRWATLLAAVAARIERLKHLAREEPDKPALEALTREELEAAILLSKTKKWRRPEELNIADAVRLVASVGGYTGKSSGGPPGSVTLGRGLERVTLTATGLKAARSDQ